MKVLVVLTCVLVAGIGHAQGMSHGMALWNPIAKKYNLCVKTDPLADEYEDAVSFFYEYYDSLKNSFGRVPNIPEPAPAVLGIFTIKAGTGEYRELLSYFNNGLPEKDSGSGCVYSTADIPKSLDLQKELKYGVEEFIKTNKSKFDNVRDKLKSVRVHYICINIATMNQRPKLYIIAQVYGVAFT